MIYSLIIDAGTSQHQDYFDTDHPDLKYIASQRYFMDVSEDGTALQKAECYQVCLEKMMQECAEWAAGRKGKMHRIALTAGRSSVLPVDEKGDPLGPIMM